MNIEKFKIIMSSDLNYEELCAEIYFQDQFVAIIDQEQGLENLKIEIHPPNDKEFWSFKLSEFEKVLQSAKSALIEMRKLPE